MSGARLSVLGLHRNKKAAPLVARAALLLTIKPTSIYCTPNIPRAGPSSGRGLKGYAVGETLPRSPPPRLSACEPSFTSSPGWVPPMGMVTERRRPRRRVPTAPSPPRPRTRGRTRKHPPRGEVRRICLPHPPVNKGQKAEVIPWVGLLLPTLLVPFGGGRLS